MNLPIKVEGCITCPDCNKKILVGQRHCSGHTCGISCHWQNGVLFRTTRVNPLPKNKLLKLLEGNGGKFEETPNQIVCICEADFMGNGSEQITKTLKKCTWQKTNLTISGKIRTGPPEYFKKIKEENTPSLHGVSLVDC